MDILNPKIDEYLLDLYGPRHKVLFEMEKEAERSDFPIVGPLVGRLLSQLARMVRARRIFEMGSGYGYSAFWWALGMDGGEIFLTEGKEENRRKGEEYLRRGELSASIKYHVGDALQIIDSVGGEFDIVFIDIQKDRYPAALEKAVPRVKRGGLIVADNVLWSGKVTEHKGDASTEAIKEFNRRLFSLKDFSTSIVPLRDGVAVAFRH